MRKTFFAIWFTIVSLATVLLVTDASTAFPQHLILTVEDALAAVAGAASLFGIVWVAFNERI